MMRFSPLELDEWVHRWRGVGTNLDISGMSHPGQDLLPDVEEGQSPLDLEERLVELISTRYGVEEERIALTFGAQNANFLTLITQLSHLDKVAVETPIYEPMRVVAKSICDVVDVPRTREHAFVPEMDLLDEILSAGARMLMLTNLHNPTAAVLKDEELSAMADIAEDRGTMVLCDEIYREMCYSDPPLPFHAFPEVGITTNGVTKLYGLGELRVGWLIGPPEVAREVQRARMAMASNLPSHSLAVTIAALERRDLFRERMLSHAKENLEILRQWSTKESRANLVWPKGALMFSLKLPKGIDDLEFSEMMLERYDTAVCPGRFFGSYGQVRVTFSCPSSEFGSGLENISSGLDHLS